MVDDREAEYFHLRKAGKTYISKVFKFSERHAERLRYVQMVFEGSDQLHYGEIEGATCLRVTGFVRKTQVVALVTQDDKQVKRISLQTFKSLPSGRVDGLEKNEFTFREDEFKRLLEFLNQIKFIDLSNEDNFNIEDISTGGGPKAIIDAADRGIVERIKRMRDDERKGLLAALHQSLSGEEINILLGRRQALVEFENKLGAAVWSETDWQDFFEREQWVFGYGLDYRFMRHFDREMTVGGAGTDNQNKPVVDFLMTFTDYTVLVEIKKPDTPIFKGSKRGRAGTWEFSAEFMGAISQIVEQKAEWLAFSQAGGDHYSKDGKKKLDARTRNAKSILIIGSHTQFKSTGNIRDETVMSDTFELFRREVRGIDIMTFDELFERARFITRNN